MANGRWLGTAVLAAVAACAARAEAAGVWMSSAPILPVEQRIAIAAGPERTTMWTSLHFKSAGGVVGVVVPVPKGASLDIASDAWFEALEAATAPRVFPPPDAEAQCPRVVAPGAFELQGDTAHVESLAPAETAILVGLPAVEAWAAKAGLVTQGTTLSSLSGTANGRFVALRFEAPSGQSTSATLRIVMPGAAPVLPLSPVRAGAEDLRVTAWIIGEGRADLANAAEVLLPSVTWRPKDGGSDYVDRRDDVLGSDASRFLVEAAGHALFTVPAVGGAGKTESIVSGFFQRAAAYGDAGGAAGACIGSATWALASSKPVAASCPTAALGVAGGASGCVESPAAGEIDPDALRCGQGADDLAIALSGLTPSHAWITRQGLVIGAGEHGTSFPVEVASGKEVSPGVVAWMDASQCDGTLFEDVDEEPPASTPDEGSEEAYVETPAVEISSEDLGGSGGDSCDCDGEAVGAGLEGCAAIAEGLADASDSCSAAGTRRSRTPRFSVVLFAALAVLVPLRRRGRARR